MTTWEEAEAAALLLPRARRGTSADGDPTVDAGRHAFARLRDLDGEPVLQVWTRDEGDVAAFRRDPAAYPRVDVHPRTASVWVLLSRVPLDVVLELVATSWYARTGRRTDPPPDYDGAVVVVEHPDGLVVTHPSGDADGPASLVAGTCREGRDVVAEAERLVREQTGLEARAIEPLTTFVQVGTPTGTMRAHGLVATAAGVPSPHGDSGPVSVHPVDALPPVVPVRLAVRRVLREYLRTR